MAYRHIAQVGAAGSLGKPVLDALVNSGKFNIKVVARHTSKSEIPTTDNARQVKVDFASHQALVDAFRGNEALVLTLGDFANLAKHTQVLTDAAIDAGVKRVILSEFGNDLYNAPGKNQAIFQAKHDAFAYVEGKAKEGKITWTTISNGGFFDWGLVHGFLGFDLKNKKATLFDGGNNLFHTTTLASIGQSVVGALSHSSATENKPLRVHDFFTTQKDILSILEAELGPFTVEEVVVPQLIEQCNAGLARGEFTPANIFGLVQAYVFGAEGSSARWPENDDSVFLGLPKLNIKEAIKKVLADL